MLDKTINSINWSLNGYDLYILLFFAIIILLCFFVLYKRIFALLFSIYISYLIILFFPFNLWLNNYSLDLISKIKIYGFVGLIIILFFMFSKYHIFINQGSWFIKKICPNLSV